MSGEGEDKKPDPQEKEDSEASATSAFSFRDLLDEAISIQQEKPESERLLQEVNIKGVAAYLKSEKPQNIVVMAGAGISTSAGIPDFRSPGSGLYDNLQKYNLPNPQAIFQLDYFMRNPEPFFKLAKELWPGTFKPTPCHYFIRLLHEKGLLLRHYTQNIDTLERVAGIHGDVIIEAHGTFHTSHCLQCRHLYSIEWMKERVMNEEVPKCEQEDCEGVVKPDIVFFGENLPKRFFECAQEDLKKCDLLIILGTSLVVQPFASLVNRVSETCPRLYINLEKGNGGGDPLMAMLGYGHGMNFDGEDNYRDVFHQAKCDDGCIDLADQLGWGEELRDLVMTEHERLDKDLSDSAKSDKPSPQKTSATKDKDSKTSSPSKTDAKTSSPSKTDAKTSSPSKTDAKTSSPSKTDAKTSSPSKTDAKMSSPSKTDATSADSSKKSGL